MLLAASLGRQRGPEQTAAECGEISMHPLALFALPHTPSHPALASVTAAAGAGDASAIAAMAARSPAACTSSTRSAQPLLQQRQLQQRCRGGGAERRRRRTGGAHTAVSGERGEGSTPQPQKLDLIESLVARVFGRAALEDEAPGGMKRLDVPEMFGCAPSTELAAPLAGDGAEVACFRPLLAATQLERKPLRLAFDAARDGWSTQALHAACDGFGAAVVWARTAGGAVVGGYNPRGWISLGEDRDSPAAFVFTWRDGDTSQPAAKLPKVGGPALAVTNDREGYGVQFGAEGLTIALQRGQERRAKSRLGTYYAKLACGSRSLFAVGEGGATDLVELRVYVAEGKGEEWTLDGIVWKTSDAA